MAEDTSSSQSSSQSSSSHTATDIITYIGVPLAVLGVLPILYNTFATLVALSRIKRTLRRCSLTALTRSDVVNRVIEIELPRYAVTPWDRFVHRREYWRLPRNRSPIPGGSWTTFNWRAHAIGSRTQRVEYADQLRQPQVEVAFDELVCYLLDLGALPDPHGWRLLRSTGLWTPVGCALLRSPDGTATALAIAPLDDSDGNLSLSVEWAEGWITRDCSHLPPYWVQLPPWPKAAAARRRRAGEAGGAEASRPASVVVGGEKEGGGPAAAVEGEQGVAAAASSLHKTVTLASEADSARCVGAAAAARPITCQITADGLVTALTHEERLQSSVQLDSLYVDHLRITTSAAAPPYSSSAYPTAPSSAAPPFPNPNGTAAPSGTPLTAAGGRTDGVWFASAVTAYGTSSQTVLWSYRIPDAVLHFSRRETVPCGVLVLLGVVPESDTPEWSVGGAGAEAEGRRRQRELELFVRRGQEQRAAVLAESRMPPAQREAASRDRVRREAELRLQDLRDRMRDEAERRETRMLEALQSPKWDTTLVAARNLAWLKARQQPAGDSGEGEGEEEPDPKEIGPIDDHADVKHVVGMLLHRMVVDGAFASRVCRMLDLWRGWADNGGMRRADYNALQEDMVAFALATLVVAVIKDSSAALEGTLSMDLQECLRMWRKVRLG